MLVISLVGRELRALARQSFTYHARVAGLGTLLALLVMRLAQGAGVVSLGGQLFARLHAAIVFCSLTVVPLLMADCISRERREGTLGMLFVTRLKPGHIVLAKGTAHAVAILSMWLAVLPILAIPFLVGGLTWTEGLISVLVVWSCLCLSIAAAVIASSQARSATAALVMAGSIGVTLFLALALVVGVVNCGRGESGTLNATDPGGTDVWDSLACGVKWALDSDACWSADLRGGAGNFVRTALAGTTAAPHIYPSLVAAFSFVALGSLAVLIVSFWVASLAIGHERNAGVHRARWASLQQLFCAPLCLKGLLRGWMRWELKHNPVGWLEERTWSGRIVTWSWVAVLLTVYAMLFANLRQYHRGFHSIQSILGGLMIISLAISSVRSFQRERQSGLLELMLVSPLKEMSIICGRLRGLWTQFLPAGFLLLSVWGYLAIYFAWSRNELDCVLFCGATFLTLPVIGLQQSLARRSVIGAFLGTIFLALIIPMLVANAGTALTSTALSLAAGPSAARHYSDTLLFGIPLQAAIATISAWNLYRDLKVRRFATT